MRYECGFTCVQFSDLQPVHVSFVVYKVAKRQVPIPALRFSSVNVIPPALYTYLHLHDTLKRRPIGQSLTVPKNQCCAGNRLENTVNFFPTLQRDNTATGLSEFTQQYKTYLCLFAWSSCRLLSCPLSILVSLFKPIILKAVVIKKMVLHKSRTPTGP